MIHYLRPENSERLSKSASAKLETLGPGKDLNIYYVTVEESINSDQVKAQATMDILHCFETLGNSTPKNILSISSQQSEDGLDCLQGQSQNDFLIERASSNSGQVTNKAQMQIQTLSNKAVVKERKLLNNVLREQNLNSLRYQLQEDFLRHQKSTKSTKSKLTTPRNRMRIVGHN